MSKATIGFFNFRTRDVSQKTPPPPCIFLYESDVFEICGAEKIACTETDLVLGDVCRADEMFCFGDIFSDT